MGDESLQTDVAARIDPICQQLEAAWQRGESPSIDEFLSRVDAADRDILRWEIERLDRAYRHRQHATADGRTPPATMFSQAAAPVTTNEHEATTAGRVSPKFGRIRDYELLDELGRGGMGSVYKALHVNLKRLVAFKILPADKTQDERALARFRREMEAVGKLVHPNIVLAHDAGQADDQHYLVMEYVEGLNLGQIASRCGPLSVPDACELARQAAMGLQYAHQHGLVHRDVKPSNLMLSANGQTKVLDLGLALLATPEGDSAFTGDCQMMGTADYMAPEQAGDCHAVDIRADIYSLGCTLYRLLVGHAPFSGSQYNTILKKLMAHANAPVTPVQEARPDLPAELSALVERMMRKSPAERFSSPAEVAQALTPFTAGHDLQALLQRAREASSSRNGEHTHINETASGLTSALEQTDGDKGAAAPSVAAPMTIPVEPRAAENLPLPPGEGRGEGGLQYDTIETQPASPRRRPDGDGNRAPHRRWSIASGAAGAVLLAGIVIIVKTKSGETKRIELPEDTQQVEVTKDGKPIAAVTTDASTTAPSKPHSTPPAAKPAMVKVRSNRTHNTIDRRVAERVLALGGTMQLLHRSLPRGVQQIGDLPADSFKITMIWLPGARLLNSDYVAMIAQLRHLRHLDVSDTPVTDADLKQIANISALQVLILGGTKLTNGGLECLKTLSELKVLSIHGIRLDIAGARTIGQLHRLEQLDLDGTNVNDEALGELQGLRRLRTLDLKKSSITQEGLKKLTKLENLEDLKLRETRVSGDWLEHLAILRRLDTLNLDGTRIGDEDVKELQAFPALHEVSLRDTRITDAAVETLSQLKRLTKLDLDGTRITEAGMRRIGEALPASNLNAQHREATRAAAKWVLETGGTIQTDMFGDIGRASDLPGGPFEIIHARFDAGPRGDDASCKLLSELSNLQSFTLGLKDVSTSARRILAHLRGLPRLHNFDSFSDTTISDVDVAALADCPLRSLQLAQAQIDGTCLEHFRARPLEYINFNFTQVGDNALAHLPISSLRILSLFGCSGVTDAGIEPLRDAKNLETLTLDNTSITDAGLQHLAELRRLWHLSLGNTRLYGEGLSHLAGLKQLEALNLRNTRIGDENLAALSGLDRLCELDLTNTGITDAGLEHLKTLGDLDLLRLDGTQVTDAGVARLQEALPNCTIFSDSHPETP